MIESSLTRAWIAAAVIVALPPGAPRAQSNAQAVSAFTNVTVVDVRTGRLAPDSAIIVRGNRIVAVETSVGATFPEGATVVNGGGAHVIPGLWDMHVHTFNNSQSAGTDNHAVHF